MEFLTDYGLFLAKIVTFVVALGIVIGLFAGAVQRSKRSDKGHLEVNGLNRKYQDMGDTLRKTTLNSEQLKQYNKSEKKRRKQERAEQKKSARAVDATEDSGEDSSEARPATTLVKPLKKRVFVLNFHGDIKASAVDNLREEVSAVLSLATADDEVVVKIESGGGMVHGYGLAASQLARIKQAGVPLTACVDKVAASGGYMMACVADKIVAAPFAILGSIGVVAQLPNFHKLLKKNNIDYEMFTAGEYKRTVTMLGENTRKGREKFMADIEDIHTLFKDFVLEYRPQVDIAKVATGEIWFGRRALDVKLADQLQTSDGYLLSQLESADLYDVEFVHKKSLPEKLGVAAQSATDRLLLTWWERLHNSRWFS